MRLYSSIAKIGFSLIALAACSAQSDDNNSPSPSRISGPSSEGASAERVEADVRFLADDLLEGREAGKRGFDLAAAYVATRYKALGLEPGGNDGSYYQDVPLREAIPDATFKGKMTFSGEGAPEGMEESVNYLVSGSYKNETNAVEAPVVFVGYGLVAPDHNRDDYAGLDVDGKIVAYLSGAPKFMNSEERAHYSRTRSAIASERGAIGAITIRKPSDAERYPFERIVKNRVGDTSMTWLDPQGVPFSSDPGLQASGYVSVDGAKLFFASAPVQWEAIAEAAEAQEGMVEGFALPFSARIEHRQSFRTLTSPNVIGILPGSDPALRDEYVVLTGHLDHEGIKPTPEEGDDEIYNGAMDNATGIASMLEVARLLRQEPPRRSVIFIALTAEEKGLIGSDYFARNPTVPAGSIVANVNLDMPIMTYEFSDIVAFGAERSNLYPVVEAAAKRANLALSPDPQPDEGFFTRSDQYSFVKQGIPAVYLDLGFGNDGEDPQREFLKEHYHQQSDEADLIDYASLGRFTQVNYEIARGIADLDERPLWNKDDFFATLFGGEMAAE